MPAPKNNFRGQRTCPFVWDETLKKFVSWNGSVAMQASDSPSIDAFSRLRVSNPETLFDSKQIFDNQPFFWDDQEVSGSGTTSTYSKPMARSRLAVSETTAGKRVRQTYMRFNYQPGKSQLIFLTTVMSSAETTGITAGVGMFDDDNGLFFQIDGTNLRAVTRTSASGTAVDVSVDQTDFNMDTLDGNGPSGVTLDPTKTQIIVIDFEWLGVGRVRMGFVIDGLIIYCHEFLNANSLTEVYMSTPNLPLRYEIENDGTGAATSMDHICTTVISEGGTQKLGLLRHQDSGSTAGLSTGTKYAVLGIRLKSGNLGATILMETLSMIATSTNDKLHWELLLNPTVAGTFIYIDQTNSSVQIATGAVANTVTGGTEMDGGYLETSLPVTNTIPNALRLGAAIDGTVDEIVIVARPITNNITVEGSLTWREAS